MTDYYNPTVVQQTIPNADMTALERLLLARIFESEEDGDGLYLVSQNGPNDQFDIAVDELRAALSKSAGVPSTAADYVAERVKEIPDGDTEVEIDFSATSWEFILQDIVRRRSIMLPSSGPSPVPGCAPTDGAASPFSSLPTPSKAKRQTISSTISSPNSKSRQAAHMFCCVSTKWRSAPRSVK
jgi:hypothetical protein